VARAREKKRGVSFDEEHLGSTEATRLVSSRTATTISKLGSTWLTKQRKSGSFRGVPDFGV
jgi:hypothetical protein